MRVTLARSKPAFSAKSGRNRESPEVATDAILRPSRSLGALIGPSFNTPMPIVASYAHAASATVGNPRIVCKIAIDGVDIPKSNRPSPIACEAASDPDPRAISTSSPCLSQKPIPLATKVNRLPPSATQARVNLIAFLFWAKTRRGQAMPPAAPSAAAPVPRRNRRRDNRPTMLMISSPAAMYDRARRKRATRRVLESGAPGTPFAPLTAVGAAGKGSKNDRGTLLARPAGDVRDGVFPDEARDGLRR